MKPIERAIRINSYNNSKCSNEGSVKKLFLFFNTDFNGYFNIKDFKAV